MHCYFYQEQQIKHLICSTKEHSWTVCADALTFGMHLYLFVILSQRLSTLKSEMLTGSELGSSVIQLPV